jgi:hypothetical protein
MRPIGSAAVGWQQVIRSPEGLRGFSHVLIPVLELGGLGIANPQAAPLKR